ncbi:MAG: DEAD/DEAH box helicase [Candidatus Nomurabacteria bacterium]|jgi:ATP-dependent DNA helicase RecG|nr:DEAD/DEAH box helicase [Candidatus Nomurabacteria bacterium]
MEVDLLATPIGKITGIGPKSANVLYARGIFTLQDFLEQILPARYHDYRTMPKIGDLMQYDGKIITVRGQIHNLTSRRVRKYHIINAELHDATGAVKVTWFNQPYIEKLLKAKPNVIINGRFGFYRDSFGITSPRIIDEYLLNERGHYVAAYTPINAALSRNNIGKIMHSLRHLFCKFPQVMPSFAEYNLLSHFKALYALHFPQNEQQVQAAQERMAFERFFIMYLANELDGQELQKLRSTAIPYDEPLLEQIITALPFTMTPDQHATTLQAARDLAKSHPTNRLIQGDVGSGKTAVAFVLAVYTALHGYQATILAPTSVLAAQHFASFQKIFADLPTDLIGSLPNQKLSAELLTGASEKSQIHRNIKNGTAQIIIGTTAILSHGVSFHKLALAIIDEQQRFGVGQRTALMQGEILPHLVSMTATPIPRSLFLATHGHTQVSSIKQKPIGRAQITSHTAKPIDLPKIQQIMRDTLARGEQIYYVCPRIIANDEDDESTRNANRPTLEREFKALQKIFQATTQVDFLHGGLDAATKDRKMWDFQTGKTSLLVTTSVIEVGVDNPNATLIIIRDADNFGLSQLHQLRGRVGRGDKPSLCYFVASTDEKMPDRLSEIAASQDGFLLAELDLDRRKIGRRLEQPDGLRQHGKNELLTHEDLITLHENPDFADLARTAAANFAPNIATELQKYPALQKRLLAYRQDQIILD